MGTKDKVTHTHPNSKYYVQEMLRTRPFFAIHPGPLAYTLSLALSLNSEAVDETFPSHQNFVSGSAGSFQDLDIVKTRALRDF